jgi:DNA (cytosine-5)-methyltransferase 3A
MNVLSLFDGISCGQIALNKLNIKVDNYFASEIELNAVKVTQHNYHDTVQIGDVRDISYNDGKLYKKNELIFEGKIDLLIGGSPCTNLSSNGDMSGLMATDLQHYKNMKQSNFDFGTNVSFLFWEYCRLLEEVNPKYFLLENVVMSKVNEYKITNELINISKSAVNPIFINSALLSAQYRKRLYWTNISNVVKPEDKDLYFKDILESNVPDHFYRKNLENLVMKESYKKDIKKCCVIGTVSNSQTGRIFDTDCKSSCLLRGGVCNLIKDEKGIRRLTPIECERLQTVPDNYTECIADWKRLAALGNG